MTDSACNALEDIRARYRGAPILSLAQTALWDDPLKAVVKGMLDERVPGARLVLGVMDTDYFSRLPHPPGGAAPYDVLPHNDGSTRDLWAAVGEMSSLFGAETPLPLDALARYGVSPHRLAQDGDGGAFVDALTEAWGWRGLAQTGGRRLLAGNVDLKDLAEPLTRQLEWAFAETARVANRPLGPFVERLKEDVAAFISAHPDGSLADLYLALLPALYAALLGYEPHGLEYTRSSELLRFNRDTANRARFRPLDLFLNPNTAATAKRLYNEAVRDGGIATLDRFGPNALPFDLAIPGHGRGTLHLSDTSITVDTDDPVEVALSAPVRSRRALASVLEARFGPRVALLGKAVVLITMLAGEYIFLFNETGSPYVSRSCRWNERLGREGLGLNLYPILRLGVKPWDAVAEAGGDFTLPPHMARVFDAETVSASAFQEEWRLAAWRAEETLTAIQRLQKPGEWLDYLAQEEELRGTPSPPLPLSHAVGEGEAEPDVHAADSQRERPAPPPRGEAGRGQDLMEASHLKSDVPSPGPSRREGDQTVHAASLLSGTPVPPLPLGERGPGSEGYTSWKDRAEEHRRLLSERAAHGETVRALNARGAALLTRLRGLRAEAERLEHAKGGHFRARIQPARERIWAAGHGANEDVRRLEEEIAEEMDCRAGFDREIAARRADIARVQEQRAGLAQERRALVGNPEVAIRSARLRALEAAAEHEKALRIRDAWMTKESLQHTQPRPSAWWFPAVDPGGAWFRAMAATADLRWQTLNGGENAACTEPAQNALSEDALLTI